MEMQKEIINHTYDVNFNTVDKFNFFKPYKDTGINVTSYYFFVEEELPRIIDELNKNPKSRRAILTINRGFLLHMSCLISVHFLIRDDILRVFAHYRSQAFESREDDSRMLNYLTTSVLKKLDKNISNKIKDVFITVNVGSYHTPVQI